MTRRPGPVRHILDITPDLICDNDDRPAPGRIGVHLLCEDCRSERYWKLPVGRFAIDHSHDDRWTAHLLRLTPPEPQLPAQREARAFVDALAATGSGHAGGSVVPGRTVRARTLETAAR